MTVTHGVINVILASKSQLQKVVLPPLRRASQRIGPSRPTKAHQVPGRHKAHKAHCPTRCSRPTTLGRQAACPTLVQQQAAGRASPSSCGGHGHSCSTVTPLLKAQVSQRAGFQEWFVIDTY